MKEELNKKERLLIHIKKIQDKLDEVLDEETRKNIQKDKTISPMDEIDELFKVLKK